MSVAQSTRSNTKKKLELNSHFEPNSQRYVHKPKYLSKDEFLKQFTIKDFQLK